MKYKRALIKCRHCGKWTGWISRTKGGVKAIDTKCRCCHRRLRHTERRDEGSNKYGPGRGAHNRSSSVIAFEPTREDVDVCRLAAKRNEMGQLQYAQYIGAPNGFVKAKDYRPLK
jgi:hypothetical protein